VEADSETEKEPEVSKEITVDYTEPLSWHASYQRIFWVVFIFVTIIQFGLKVDLLVVGVWLIISGLASVTIFLAKTIPERSHRGCGFFVNLLSTGRDLSKMLLVTSILTLFIISIFIGNELAKNHDLGNKPGQYVENVIAEKFELAPKLFALLLFFSVIVFVVFKRLARIFKSRNHQKLIYKNRAVWSLEKYSASKNVVYLNNACNCLFQAGDQPGLEECAGKYIEIGRLDKVFDILDTEMALPVIDKLCLNGSNQKFYADAVKTLEASEPVSLAGALANLALNNSDHHRYQATLDLVFDLEQNFKVDSVEFWVILIHKLHRQISDPLICKKLTKVLQEFDGFDLGFGMAKIISNPMRSYFKPPPLL
jgi:hypothetical protein